MQFVGYKLVYISQGYAVVQLVEALLQARRLHVQFPNGTFYLLNLSSRTTALGSTQPLIGMSTRDISWGGEGGQCVGLTTLPPSYTDCRDILKASTTFSCNGLSRPVME